MTVSDVIAFLTDPACDLDEIRINRLQALGHENLFGKV
jgi:hypothetical protein